MTELTRDIGWGVHSPTVWPYHHEGPPTRVTRPSTRLRVMMEGKRMMIDRLYQQAGGDLTPEQHILLAVIDQALYDALVNSATGSWGRILKADAEAFLRSDYCGWILEQLLINRDWFNREITKLRAAAKILAARDVAREEQRAVERGSLL